MQTETLEAVTGSEADVEQVVLEASALGESAGVDEQSVPTRILIVPAGEVRSTSGSFVVDDEAMAATVAAFEAHGTDLPIDYEHQTLGGAYSSPTGQAPAAGWIKSLLQGLPLSSVDDGHDAPVRGLWAEVSWTAEAQEKLANREYRYVSPVALVRRSDRRLVGIHSVALTNKPAIVGMQPVVNRVHPEREQVGPAVGAPIEAGVTLTALREILALDDSADEAVVLATALGRIRALQEAEAGRWASQRVEAAMAAGKLSAAQRAWALALAQRDPAEFDRWEASAPKVVALGRTVPPDEKTEQSAVGRRVIESSARAEWRAHKDFLEKLCTEAAYVAEALRDSGL